MSNLTIEVCKNRTEAEERKKQIKELAPDAIYQSRIIEGLESVTMFLTKESGVGGSTELLAEAFNGDLNVSKIAVLIIWI